MYGTPVLKVLDCWSALPIVIRYGGVANLDPPAVEDNDNIIAALKQSARVSSISLTVTSSLLEKLSAISEPFSKLEELFLLSQENMHLTLPSTFQWGPRLHTLHSTGIGFPSFLQLLLPSHDLVDSIQLHEIPGTGYFSPYAFANVSSQMAQLQTISLNFLSLPPIKTSSPCLHSNMLFSLLSCASDIEELASTWTVSWPESMHLVLGMSILHYLANQRLTFQNLANSSSRQKC
jgi:hypothetical protein